MYAELDRHNEAVSCYGISYLSPLDDGISQVPNLDSYVRVVQEKATLRRSIFAAQHMMNRCLEARDGSADMLAEAEALLSKLADNQKKHGQWLQPGEVMLSYSGGTQE